MTVPVFGLQAIKDKATRDAIYQLAQRSGTGSGDGSGVSVGVQSSDPNVNDPGEEGNIIYATSTDSIWIFTGTLWERARGGNGIYIEIRMRYAQANGDYNIWTPAPANFRNGMNHVFGGVEVETAVVATLIENGEARTDAEHENYTYTWYRNGALVQPKGAQNPYTGVDKRALIITHEDVSSFGDAFTCEVDYN